MIIKNLIKRYPSLICCESDIRSAVNAIIRCYENEGKLLLCGNGGSGADCEHISGELMKGFLKKRPLSAPKRDILSEYCSRYTLDTLQEGLPAIPLTGQIALSTAFANDCAPQLVFAQQVLSLGRKGDLLIGISTSGNSVNVLEAINVAKGLEITTIALVGSKGGTIADAADIVIAVPETETFKVQELHLPVYHALCAAVEERFFEI